MLRQKIQQFGVRRDARLRAMFGTGKGAGSIRPAQCLRHAHAPIQRCDQHATESVASRSGIDRHDSKGILHDQLAFDPRAAASLA